MIPRIARRIHSLQKTETHPLLEFFLHVCIRAHLSVYVFVSLCVCVRARPFVPSGSLGRAVAMRNPTAVVLFVFFLQSQLLSAI